jgi:hypothetical protein
MYVNTITKIAYEYIKYIYTPSEYRVINVECCSEIFCCAVLILFVVVAGLAQAV